MYRRYLALERIFIIFFVFFTRYFLRFWFFFFLATILLGWNIYLKEYSNMLLL